MNKLYPLKFKPIFKEKIWGGSRMKEALGLDFSPLPNCGEAWMLSGVEGNQSVVSNGFLAENELNELVEVYMENLVGDTVFEKHGQEFPILIKFIDSNDWLSIQVHPDDLLARKRNLGNGKTEMWYVMDAAKDAKLINGFSEQVNKQLYMQHLEKKTLKEILNFEQVEKGDVFYIPAGRVHSLGPGILLAEIQQTSDTTYRIYDWDRIQPDGSFRELHTKEALDAIDFKLYDSYKSSYDKKINESINLVESPYFISNLLKLDRAIAKDFTMTDSFVAYVCTNGKCKINYPDGTVELQKGEVVLVPAIINDISILPDPATELLEVYTH